MIYNFFTSSAHVLRFLAVFLSISLLISSVQHLVNINCFSSEGLLPWTILKNKKPLINERYYFMFSKTGMLLLNIIRIVLLAFFLYSTGTHVLVLLVALTLITSLIYFRTSLMTNAADQVNNIVLIGLLIHQLLSFYSSENLIIYFFALLLLTSYFTSGLLKVYEVNWLNGMYLRQVLLTRNYAHPFLLKIIGLINESVFKILSRVIVFWQLSSFLMLFFPTPAFYCYLFIAFCFHLTTGIFMRLNGFLWTFIGLLPTLIYIHSKIYPCL